MVEYQLFPGCVIQNRIPYIEASAKFVFDKLGVEYCAGEFSCCPNPVGLKFVDEKTWVTIAARNACEGEIAKKPIMSLCNGCYQSLYLAQHKLNHDPILKKEVNTILAQVGKEFKGDGEIYHFVKVLKEKVGIEKIKSMIVKPLTGLKVALHPGCHYMRPSHILHGEDPMKPVYLRELCEAAGATVVDYPEELLCCGNAIRQTDAYTANTMLKAKVDAARAVEADCFVVNCPACYQQFDTEQGKLKTLPDIEEGVTYKFPVFYITELFALAMGKSPDEIGLKFHRNKGKEALAKMGF